MLLSSTVALMCHPLEAGRPLPDIDRLTPLGCFLGTASYDELPEPSQLLRGDMSLVGPRPLSHDPLPLFRIMIGAAGSGVCWP
jgi:lipopolysaccharide/colanic/teichoic acid biosynthesis glycosyltransferase